MNTHSEEEKNNAKKTLPEELSVFFDSPELKSIYADIAVQFKLNLRQMSAFTEATELTLLGLEPETEFATHVRTLLPELSTEELKKLLEYADLRVFAEARHHLMTPNSHETPEKNR